MVSFMLLPLSSPFLYAGTPDDWVKVRKKAEALAGFGVEWWLAGLLPALDRFVLASLGKPDLDFWRSLCQIDVGTSFPVYEPIL